MKVDEILQWFIEHPSVEGHSMEKVCRHLDAPPDHVRHKVRKLVEKGVLVRVGGKRGPGVTYAYKPGASE